LLGKTTCRPPSLRDPQWQGTPSDREGTTTVSNPRETVEKETADQPLKPAASGETVIRVSRLYVEVSLVFDFIVWEYFYVFLII